jgi:hypothetical protein
MDSSVQKMHTLVEVVFVTGGLRRTLLLAVRARSGILTLRLLLGEFGSETRQLVHVG